MTGVSTRFVVESLLRTDGTAPLAEVYDVGNALGLADQPLRLTVRRLTATGAFTQEGRGRAGTLRRSAGAEVTEGHDAAFVRFAYRRDAGLAPWDGAWHLVVLTVPERERAARDLLRRTLVRLGGAALHPGVHVSPNPWEEVVAAEVAALGEAAGSVGRWSATTRDLRLDGVDGVDDPRALAARLWPLQRIAERYEALAHLADGPAPAAPRDHPGRVELLREALQLAAAFDHAIAPDPLLPLELLPAPWPPVAARAAFRARWRVLHEALAAGGTHLFRRFGTLLADDAGTGAGTGRPPGPPSPGGGGITP